MRITISNINTLVSHAISDSHSGEPHINQQADMAMSDSVDPYSLHSANSTTTANFVMQIGFRELEYAVVLI